MSQNTSIGGFLAGLGMNRTVFKSSLERVGTDRKTLTAQWNPQAPYDGVSFHSFELRYGFVPGGPGSPSAGSLTGERVSDDLLRDLARHPSNPLALIDNGRYNLQPGDHEDVEYGSLDGTTAVWDGFFAPAIARLVSPAGGGGTGPVVRPETPTTTPPPTQTTTPASPATPRDPVIVPGVSPQVPNPFQHGFLGKVPYSRMVKAFGGRVAWPFEAYVRRHQAEEEVLAIWLHRLDGDPDNPIFQELQVEFGA